MGKRIICILLVGLLWVAPVRAQEDLMEISTDDASLSMAVPEGWSVVISDPTIDAYAMMSNRTNVLPGETATEIQMVLRSAGALGEAISNPIDLESENPALDYLQKYAQWQSNRVMGIYDPPRAVEGGEYPAALMLYIEKSQLPRFGTDISGLLSLAVVVYLGEGNMGVVLADGRADTGRSLFTMWSNAFTSLQVNGKTLPFTADLSQELLLFNTPENMYSVYRAIVGETPVVQPAATLQRIPFPEGQGIYLTRNGYEIAFPIFHPWEIVEQTESSAELATLEGKVRVWASFHDLPEDYQLGNPSLLLPDLLDDYTLVGEAVTFNWGGLPTALATLQPSAPAAEFQLGSLALLQMPDRESYLVLQMAAQADVPDQPLLDWRDMLMLMQLNGEELSIDLLLAAFEAAPPLR